LIPLGTQEWHQGKSAPTHKKSHTLHMALQCMMLLGLIIKMITLAH